MDTDQHICRRCRNPSETRGLCQSCKAWLKATKYTHCHGKACDDPENPTKFDKVKNTKYGKEYHCAKCDSWINFGMLADFFSIPRSEK